MWYDNARIVMALRKHVLRVDLHTHVGEIEDFNSENDLMSSIRSLMSAAIYKGLDVIGVVSHESPQIGMIAKQIVQQDGIDLFVIPGQECYTPDKVRFIAFNVPEIVPGDMMIADAIKYVHQKGGFVLVIEVPARQLQLLNKLEGTDSAPDGIEIYNGISGQYKDIQTNYPKFVSSAAKTPHELDKINVFTSMSRKELEGINLLPEHYGEEYIPKYLLPAQPQVQENPQGVQ